MLCRDVFYRKAHVINCKEYNVYCWYLQKEDAKKLVRDAIAAGIFNDLGSGSNVDLCIITKDGIEYLRPYDEANLKGVRLAFLFICILS